MLWHQAWLETRWRFLIGLAVLTCSAVVVVYTYPYVAARIASLDAATADVGGMLGAQIREGLTVTREYRGYVWWQWFRQNLRDVWTVLAVLLGTGGLLAQTSGGGALYTLSLPISRSRLLQVRAVTGLAELTALAFMPTLAIWMLSPTIGQQYSAVEGVVHAICMVIGGTVFFSLAFALSTVFADVWRPALIALAAFYAISFLEIAAEMNGTPHFGLVTAMTGQSYFRSGDVPWAGLAFALVASGALIYAAVRNIERRDF
jgi:hypothetical protein